MSNESSSLPRGWTWASLGEVIKVLESGGRPKGGVRGYFNGIPSIGGEHLTKNGRFRFDNIRFVPESFYEAMTKGKIRRQDVLVVKDGATTGKVSFVGEDFPYERAAVNEHVFILRALNEVLHQRYLFHFLFSIQGQNQIKEKFQGTAQGGINSSFVNNFPIPVPSVAEQHRIIAKIGELFQEITIARQALQKVPILIERFRQSVLDVAFRGRLTEREPNDQPAGKLLERIKAERERKRQKEFATKRENKEPKPVDLEGLPELPKTWIWTSLGEVAYIEMGQSPPGSFYNKDGKGIPLINGPTEFGPVSPIPAQWTTKPTKICAKDDLLICVRGNTTGRMNIADQEYCIGRGLAAIRPVNNYVSRSLLFYFLQFKTNEIMARTAGSTFPNLPGEELRSLPFPLAPLQEQDIMAAKIQEMFSRADLVESAVTLVLEQSSGLEQSILAKAFRGDLVPQEPNDEPASVLLERMRAQQVTTKIHTKKKSKF